MKSRRRTSRRIKPLLRERLVALCVLLGGGWIIILLAAWLFGSVLPSFGDRNLNDVSFNSIPAHPPAQVQAFAGYWGDQTPALRWCLNVGSICALIVLGLWGVYRLCIRLGEILDSMGHWNKVISEREPRHRPRFVTDSKPHFRR